MNRIQNQNAILHLNVDIFIQPTRARISLALISGGHEYTLVGYSLIFILLGNMCEFFQGVRD